MSTDTKIPEPYDRNAPKFDPDSPEELMEFLEHMGTIMEKGKIPAADRNKKIVSYVKMSARKEWKGLPSFENGTHTEFLKEVVNHYPSIRDQEKGSIVTLNKLLNKFDTHGISIDDQDELMDLIRPMQVEVKRLIPTKLTNKIAVARFMEKLTPEFASRIWSRLDMDEVALDALPIDPTDVAAVAAKLKRQTDRETERYMFSDILRVARTLATTSADRGEYDTGATLQTSSGKRIKTEIVGVKLELGKQQRESIDELKQWTVQELDKNNLANQKLQKANDARWERVEQYLKTSAPHGSVVEHESKTTTFDSPSRMPNYNRALPNMDCHHCRFAGHFMDKCEHRRKSIEEGKLKVIDGKDFFGDGTTMYAPRLGPKSRATIIDEYYRGKAAQHYQGGISGVYSMMTDSEDDGAEYDSRNDELLTMRVSEMNLRRQLAQNVQEDKVTQLTQHQQPQRVVQPAPKIAKPEDNQMAEAVTLLTGITGQLQQQMNQLQQYVVNTRANPNKSSQNQEGFQ